MHPEPRCVEHGCFIPQIDNHQHPCPPLRARYITKLAAHRVGFQASGIAARVQQRLPTTRATKSV